MELSCSIFLPIVHQHATPFRHHQNIVIPHVGGLDISGQLNLSVRHRGRNYAICIVGYLQTFTIDGIAQDIGVDGLLMIAFICFFVQAQFQLNRGDRVGLEKKEVVVSLVFGEDVGDGFRKGHCVLEVPMVVPTVVEIKPATGIDPENLHAEDLGVWGPFYVQHVCDFFRQVELQVSQRVLLPKYDAVYLLIVAVDEI